MALFEFDSSALCIRELGAYIKQSLTLK